MTLPPHGDSFYTVPSLADPTRMILFEAQPIVSLHDWKIVGRELLYRGPLPATWPDIDATLLHFLSVSRNLPLVFVNLSNQGLLDATVDSIATAAVRNTVIFELSESVVEYAQRGKIADRINVLIDKGVSVAVDDFGSGRDSLERIYELKLTRAVKLDGAFLQTCSKRADAAGTLTHLVKQWRLAGIWSIAEGVETPELLEFARSIGIDMVQGWHVNDLVRHPKHGSARSASTRTTTKPHSTSDDSATSRDDSEIG